MQTLAPPGCPQRKVTAINREPGGATFTLSCGHRQWAAGWAGVTVDGYMRPCLQGPCYQRQRSFGDN